MPDLWDQLLKRVPLELRGRVQPVFPLDGLYQVKRRLAWGYFDCPAGGALVASGGLYSPPVGGAIIRAVACNGDNLAPATWRCGLVNAADINLSAVVSNGLIRPVYPDAPLRGLVENWQFFSLGDLSGALASGTVAYPNALVMPGNFFAAALTGDNAIAEGFFLIEELIGGSEETL